ncbi:MAG: 8-oxo-dGTP diphosphatase [Candidatus Aenigmarchaeota archaeon]|nr:8-oxo-dGTP diphosphatase [Candidatus Aenigmarchaeota archaeon]
MKDATLCYIMDRDRILLQKKAAGFGAGKWNAPGGKIRPGESPERAAVREVQEETGLRVDGMEQMGVLNFLEKDGDAIGHFFTVHVFKVDHFSGQPQESREGPLEWFTQDHLPYDQMWEDDRIWLPAMLRGEKFRGDFLFDKGFQKMLDHHLVKV